MTEAQLALVLAAVAALGAIVSAVIAVLARRDSQISAKASVKAANAAHQEVAEARRANDREEAASRAALNAELRAALSIQQHHDGRFRFRNEGGRAIRSLRIVDPPASIVDGDQVFEVPIRGDSSQFGVNVDEDHWPAFLMLQWQGLDEPEPINFPPRGPRVWSF